MNRLLLAILLLVGVSAHGAVYMNYYTTNASPTLPGSVTATNAIGNNGGTGTNTWLGGVTTITNLVLPAGFTNAWKSDATNAAASKIAMNGGTGTNIVLEGLTTATNLSVTKLYDSSGVASTVAAFNAGTNLYSIANGAGFLENDGGGAFTWVTSLNASNLSGNVPNSSIPGWVASGSDVVNATNSSALHMNATNLLNNLQLGNFNGSSGASGTTFWRGDGTWATPAGSSGANATNLWSTNSIVMTAPTNSGSSGQVLSFVDAQHTKWIPAGAGDVIASGNNSLTGNNYLNGSNMVVGTFNVQGAFRAGDGSILATNATFRTNDPAAKALTTYGDLWVNGNIIANGAGVTNYNATNLVHNLAIANFNSGTAADATTYWRGDGTWVTPSTSATGIGTTNGSGYTNTLYYLTAATNTASSSVPALTVNGNLLVNGLATFNSTTNTSWDNSNRVVQGWEWIQAGPWTNSGISWFGSTQQGEIDASGNATFGTVKGSSWNGYTPATNTTAGITAALGSGAIITNFHTVAVTLSNAANAFSGSGAGLTGTAAGLTAGAATTATTAGNITAGATINSANGANLTNLVTSRLVPGTSITFGTNNAGTATETLTINSTPGSGASYVTQQPLTNNIQATNVTVLGTLTASGGSLSGALTSSATSALSGPAENELPTAQWVRSLFNNGIIDYTSTNIMAGATNTDLIGGAPIYTFQSTIPISDARVYSGATVVTNNAYIGGVMTTNQFTFIQGPIDVNAFIGQNGSANESVSVHPEIYYSYDKTNWLGDWTASAHTLTHGATNLHQWVISFPAVTSTNTAGFYLQRRFKVDTATGTTPSVVFVIGTNATSGINNASHIALAGPSSGAGNAYLANNQTFTGVNLFSGTVAGNGGGGLSNVLGAIYATNYVGGAITLAQTPATVVTNNDTRSAVLPYAALTTDTGTYWGGTGTNTITLANKYYYLNAATDTGVTNLIKSGCWAVLAINNTNTSATIHCYVDPTVAGIIGTAAYTANTNGLVVVAGKTAVYSFMCQSKTNYSNAVQQ